MGEVRGLSRIRASEELGSTEISGTLALESRLAKDQERLTSRNDNCRKFNSAKSFDVSRLKRRRSTPGVWELLFRGMVKVVDSAFPGTIPAICGCHC